MVPTLSRQDERRGTRRLMLGGSAVAVILFAAVLVWAFVFVPRGELGSSAHQPSGATGVLANQGAGESTAAKNDAITPEKSATGGSAQNSNGEAAQIDQSAGPLKLSDAQRQAIHSYFAGNPGDHAQSADFALSVGAAVPQEVKLQPLPLPIVSAMAGFQGDQYIIVGTQLVIVDANARRVVAVVPDVS